MSIVGRNQKRLNEVAEQIIIQADSPKPLPIVADITHDAQRIIDETVNHFGQIDVLVNNAGIFRADSVHEFNVTEYDNVMETNLKSAIILTNLAVPYLEKTKGNIINVSSDAGLTAYGTYLSYCISKAGLDQFTKCAAIALAPKRIRVNSINPADIRTPIFASIGVKPDEYYEKVKDWYLVGRVGEVTDTSAAIEFLATQSFINGIQLPVDGGLTCSGIRAE